MVHTPHTSADGRTLLWTTNAKLVGSIYLAASLCYGISGLLMSWIMRGELGGLGEQLLFGDHQLYNTLTTSQRAYWRVYLPPLTVVWYSSCTAGHEGKTQHMYRRSNHCSSYHAVWYLQVL